MQRIWTSKNETAARRESSPSASVASASWAVAAFCALASVLFSGCAGSKAQGAAIPVSPQAAPTTEPAAQRVTPDKAFMATNVASEASEFIRLGRESMRDSAWFEASEYLDSAMAHLALLETQPSLNARQRLAVQVYQDSVRDWLVESVSQSARFGAEADDFSEYIDHEIEEVSFASLEDLEALLPRLPNRNYGLPLPSPLPHSVLQAMKVFTGSGRGYFEKWLQRKGRYEPMIHAKLDERGMPRDLVYLAMVESGFNPKAWSHASASGLWQFISPTGRRYGLNDDWWEDSRRDPVRATDAALDYLEDLYSEFDDWHQAMAAYNCGEGRIRRQLRADPQLSYWDMSLPAETRFYVPKILAAMIIGNNPASFGFRIEDKLHAPLAFDTVTVTRCLPLSGIASAVGVHEDSLKSLNPSLRRWCTPPGRARYTVYLPEGTREIFLGNYTSIQTEARVTQQTHVVGRGQTLSGIAARYGVTTSALQRANGLKGTKLRRGQSLIIPGGGSEPVAAVAPAAVSAPATEARTARASSETHTVRRGETLSGIARRYGVSASAVQAASGLGSSRLRVGQRLTIPGDGQVAAAHSNSGADLRVETVSTTAENISSSSVRRHTVRRGETLGGIARQFRVSVSALRRLNDMTPRAVLRIGQVLKIPSTGRSASESEEVRVDPNLGRKVYVVRQGDNLSQLAERFGVSQGDLKRWNGLRDADIQVGQRLVYHGGNEAVRRASASNEYYRVKSGDNLWEISSRFGQSVEDVKRLNGGLTEDLHPGQRIRVR